MIEKKVVDEIEDVFISELGIGSSFILEQNLREMGLSRETFQVSDVDNFVEQLLKEYDKVLGNHVNIIKTEIEKKFTEDQ
jgi:sulfur relay (sulfurtransferase) DsrF/TusC family protein